MTASNSTELLACFDENGNTIEPMSRSIVHKKPYRIWHAVTAVWMLNERHELLVTKRSMNNEGNPGKWQTYVGGHVRSNQSVKEAALSEVREEVGIDVASPELLQQFGKRQRREAMHFMHMFALYHTTPLDQLKFTDGEIEEARWMSFTDYKRSKSEHPETWCNSISEDQYDSALRVLSEKLAAD